MLKKPENDLLQQLLEDLALDIQLSDNRNQHIRAVQRLETANRLADMLLAGS